MDGKYPELPVGDDALKKELNDAKRLLVILQRMKKKIQNTPSPIEALAIRIREIRRVLDKAENKKKKDWEEWKLNNPEEYALKQQGWANIKREIEDLKGKMNSRQGEINDSKRR